MDQDNVESQHTCTICMRLLYEPITLECSHNFCKLCLKLLLRSTTSESKLCPMCRFDLGDFDLDTSSINSEMRTELKEKYPELYKERRKEFSEEIEDEKNKYVKKLVVGNDCKDSFQRGDEKWKLWTFYVLMEEEENLSEYIEKIVVNLHSTFSPSQLTFKKPPFEVQRSGWGTFEINFTVYFTEQTKKRPLDLSWYLSFRDGGRQRTFDLEFDKRILQECGLFPMEEVTNNNSLQQSKLEFLNSCKVFRCDEMGNFSKES